ncbi:Tat pathway signal protein [Sphingomonas sp. Leaf33]|uniref:glycoside hydrolase family 125 protein n=1 Tax=Sphingomonas sp. Leaf33 TaxID=1736215 RepID=UPI0006FE8149|nr:glycoside hydrolase family 125 protein [Sphingomonas sp. Leaf33]KQN20599.1 Tat pathway signal protein [Sphingomonas sp. Leaf33]
MTITRRTFVGATAALAALPAHAKDDAPPATPTKRPPVTERKFVSKAIEREIVRVKAKIADPKLAWMFENAYPNTLDTTVRMSTVAGRPDSFVITGDIPCLWLRDSAAQVKPYLHLIKKDPKLDELFRGLIARHARSILIDPYANAFMEDPTAKTNLGWALKDETEMRPGVAERKWEIDSLCYALRLAYLYWREMRDPRPFDVTWAKSARLIVQTFREQQRKDGPGPYSFRRTANQPSETLLWGHGNPTRPVGLIHSGFRPSDDACLYPFLIPANMFAVITLRELAVVAAEAAGDMKLAMDAKALSDEVETAIQQYGKMRLRDGREVWAYEVDGFGNAVFMDDANVPSLSGLGYLGCVKPEDPLWRRTEAAAWSDANPWFFRGKAVEGIGGPHVGPGQVWPMSLTIRALSAVDDTTVRQCLKWLRDTDGGTGFIHEAVDQDNPAKFTRDWFAWANGLFGELIVKLADERPHILGTEL